MRRLAILTGLLCLTLAALAQTPAAQKKSITDPEEYKVYLAALNEQAPAKKVQLLDEFLTKYPNTVVKEDALELKLVALQQAGQPSDATARQILEVNPNNLRSLLVLSFVFAQSPLSEQDPQFQQKLADAESLAKRGLDQIGALPKPENVSDADFQKSKNMTSSTFHQAIGVVGLARKDFPSAQNAFRSAATENQQDASVFYRLANAYVSEKPPKYDPAMWAFARAVVIDGPTALAPAGKTQVDQYLTTLYTRYHGSDEGLAKLKEDAKSAAFPPEGFHVMTKAEMAPPPPPKPEPPPIPADVSQMSFGQMKEVLSAGGDKAKEVFGKLKGTGLGLEGKVVSALPALHPRTIRIAVLPATQGEEGAYDVVLTLTAASLKPVTAGKTVEFEGTVNTMKESPFSLGMIDGKIIPPKAEAPPKAAPKTGSKTGAKKKG